MLSVLKKISKTTYIVGILFVLIFALGATGFMLWKKGSTTVDKPYKKFPSKEHFIWNDEEGNYYNREKKILNEGTEPIWVENGYLYVSNEGDLILGNFFGKEKTIQKDTNNLKRISGELFQEYKNNQIFFEEKDEEKASFFVYDQRAQQLKLFYVWEKGADGLDGSSVPNLEYAVADQNISQVAFLLSHKENEKKELYVTGTASVKVELIDSGSSLIPVFTDGVGNVLYKLYDKSGISLVAYNSSGNQVCVRATKDFNLVIYPGLYKYLVCKEDIIYGGYGKDTKKETVAQNVENICVARDLSDLHNGSLIEPVNKVQICDNMVPIITFEQDKNLMVEHLECTMDYQMIRKVAQNSQQAFSQDCKEYYYLENKELYIYQYINYEWNKGKKIGSNVDKMFRMKDSGQVIYLEGQTVYMIEKDKEKKLSENVLDLIPDEDGSDFIGVKKDGYYYINLQTLEESVFVNDGNMKESENASLVADILCYKNVEGNWIGKDINSQQEFQLKGENKPNYYIVE